MALCHELNLFTFFIKRIKTSTVIKFYSTDCQTLLGFLLFHSGWVFREHIFQILLSPGLPIQSILYHRGAFEHDLQSGREAEPYYFFSLAAAGKGMGFGRCEILRGFCCDHQEALPAAFCPARQNLVTTWFSTLALWWGPDSESFPCCLHPQPFLL